MADSNAALAAQVAELRERLDVLAGAIDALTPSPASAIAPNWADDAGEVPDADDLAVWVGYLCKIYGSYTRGVIRECWLNHSEAVWELGNLWAMHDAIYGQEKPSLR